jgi:hypothetical protein
MRCNAIATSQEDTAEENPTKGARAIPGTSPEASARRRRSQEINAMIRHYPKSASLADFSAAMARRGAGLEYTSVSIKAKNAIRRRYSELGNHRRKEAIEAYQEGRHGLPDRGIACERI